MLPTYEETLGSPKSYENQTVTRKIKKTSTMLCESGRGDSRWFHPLLPYALAIRAHPPEGNFHASSSISMSRIHAFAAACK